MISRKQFLKAGGGYAALLATSDLVGRSPFSGSMARSVIPHSGESIGKVGIGTWRLNHSKSAGYEKLLSEFVRLGGDMVDTSPMYEPAEEILGKKSAKAGVQDELFFASKVWTRGREAGIQQMRRTLELLGIDRIELMQVHNLMDVRAHLKTIREWKEQGLVRYSGITHYTDSAQDDVVRIIKHEPVDFLQINYSIFSREAEKRVLPIAADRGVAVIANRPFRGGSSFAAVQGKTLPDRARGMGINSWAQFFLKYILANQQLTVAIPGTFRMDHLYDNLSAGYGSFPDDRSRRWMVRVIESL